MGDARDGMRHDYVHPGRGELDEGKGGEEGGDGVEEEADVLGEELDEDGGYEVLYELEEEQDKFYCLWCQSLVF